MKKVFIITGANRGLGQAFTEILTQTKGNLVVSISRSLSKEQERYPVQNFQFLKVELSEKDLYRKIGGLKSLIGESEVCFISNAGSIDPIGKIEGMNEEAIERTVSVNIKAPILIMQYLLRHFGNNKLSFVNISSGAAHRAIANWSLYCSAKAFMDMYFKVAQIEYPKYKFYSIDPGAMDTGMQKKIRESHFPDVATFKGLEKDGKLKSPRASALEILRSIL